jgi:hypothetical protein
LALLAALREFLLSVKMLLPDTQNAGITSKGRARPFDVIPALSPVKTEAVMRVIHLAASLAARWHPLGAACKTRPGRYQKHTLLRRSGRLLHTSTIPHNPAHCFHHDGSDRRS